MPQVHSYCREYSNVALCLTAINWATTSNSGTCGVYHIIINFSFQSSFFFFFFLIFLSRWYKCPTLCFSLDLQSLNLFALHFATLNYIQWSPKLYGRSIGIILKVTNITPSPILHKHIVFEKELWAKKSFQYDKNPNLIFQHKKQLSSRSLLFFSSACQQQIKMYMIPH